jgi:NADPH:quinone reductase-like Zn-dependent oxidoreductase
VRAVVVDRYGPPEVLRVAEVDRPVPTDDEVLVRVHASTVNRTDTGLRSAEYAFARVFSGIRRPRQRILGTELAGEVEAVGPAVTGFEVGDRVFGLGEGTNAEYVCVRASGPLGHVPAGMPFSEAAAIPDGGCIALTFLRSVRLSRGQRILIYGASGSIGTAAVQLAVHIGAEVVAVCDTPSVEIVRSLGADRVIDRLREDFTTNGEGYDVVLDAVGKLPAWRGRGSLKAGGIFITAGSPGSIGGVLLLGLVAAVTSRKVRLGVVRYRKEHLLYLKDLVEAGAYRPVIDRVYPLDQVVEAHRYVDTERKTGNVVLTLDDRDAATA